MSEYPERIVELDEDQTKRERRFLPANLQDLELWRLENVHTPNYKLGSIVKMGRAEALVVAIDHNKAQVVVAVLP